jgi:hypothetical protein
MPLLDLKDIKSSTTLTEEGKDDIAKVTDSHFNYGNHSEKIIELDQQEQNYLLVKCLSIK